MYSYRTFKIILIGDSSVGKTSLLYQYINKEFTGRYRATIGSDFLSKQLDIDGEHINLHIWDTAGRERFQSLSSDFFDGTDCCILVYDVTDHSSFENISFWMNMFLEQLGPFEANEFPFMLLGNKIDLQNKTVQQTEAREFAVKRISLFYEVSAKNSINVQTAFEAIVKKALEIQSNNGVIK